MAVNHGFVVQNSIIPLDLSSSKENKPVVFIKSLDSYAKDCDKELCDQKNSVKTTSVVFWDYYDAERQAFENNIFEDYEQNILELRSKVRVRNYLKICKIMCRCSDLEESARIFSLLVDLLMEECVDDSQLIAEFLETVCVTYETILAVFLESDNLKYLDSFLFHLSKAKRNLFGFWSGPAQSISDCNLTSQYLFQRHYDNAIVVLKYGLSWEFCESVFMDYCRTFDSLWTVDVLTQADGLYHSRNIDRFFLILQTFFVVKDWKSNGYLNSLEALSIAWRSIPDVFISPQEMAAAMRSLATPSPGIQQEIVEVCETYGRLFWNSQEGRRSPRALKDICRCSIRRRLSENFQLPYGLSELNIPYRMQMFLKLEI